MISTLSGSMPYNSAISSSKSRIVVSVSLSIIRHVSSGDIEGWNKSYVLHDAIRMSSSYRTISSDAVCVIAGMISVCLLLEERSSEE